MTGRGRRHRWSRPSPDGPQPAASDSHLPWLMLDRVVHCTKVDGIKTVRDGVAAGGTLLETSDTCTGQTLAVSLRVASPPAASRLYLHWPEGLKPEMKELPLPYVIAAHRHSILFQAYVPHVDQCRPPCYPVDYFVYTARSDKSPSLRRLPPCFKGGQVDPEMDQLFKPYRLQQQRLMRRHDISLLCHGEEEFTVADLSYDGELCLLRHAPGEGVEAMKWDVKKLQMPLCKDAPDLFSDPWQTDVVIPYGDSSLCWVDCYLGLFFVTVHGDLTKKPHYVPMPAALDSRRAGCPDPARHVCVTDSGMIKLICISDLAGRSLHSSHHTTFKITTWNLTDNAWEVDATMETSELWAALASDKRLPLLRPVFPTMSLVDHDVVYFVLNDRQQCISWLIEVDLQKKVLGAVTLYIDEQDEMQAAEEEQVTCKTFFFDNPFIPSKFTVYLDKHAYFDKNAIKSLSFSKKLEETKLKRAMEEGWIKEPKQFLLPSYFGNHNLESDRQ